MSAFTRVYFTHGVVFTNSDMVTLQGVIPAERSDVLDELKYNENADIVVEMCEVINSVLRNNPNWAVLTANPSVDMWSESFTSGMIIHPVRVLEDISFQEKTFAPRAVADFPALNEMEKDAFASFLSKLPVEMEPKALIWGKCI